MMTSRHAWQPLIDESAALRAWLDKNPLPIDRNETFRDTARRFVDHVNHGRRTMPRRYWSYQQWLDSKRRNDGITEFLAAYKRGEWPADPRGFVRR